MSLPTDADYQEAIQNPREAFSDPELQSGRPELMSAALPLPKARSGNFAVAFRMDCGKRSWAVKCFTRALHADLQVRYTEISKHLAAVRLPYTADFTFLERGIRVRGNWYPILKMEWISGNSLIAHVQQNLRNLDALNRLAEQWIEMARALRQANIAHGDLQHGNVLVTAGGLKLIDYDGMYVPALAGRPSHEKGHENYQHPLRENDFGPDLDNFSAWVILLSIRAVAHEPQLWDRFNGGDECLLFRRRDFLNPDRSPLIQALLGSRAADLRSLTRQVRAWLDCPPQGIPPLDSLSVRAGPDPVPPASTSLPGVNWIARLLRQDASRDPRPAVAAPEARWGPSWVHDFPQPASQPAPNFESRPHVEGLIAALTLVWCVLVLLDVFPSFLPPVALRWSVPGMLVGNPVLWLVLYRQDANVKLRRELLRRLAEVDREFAKLETKLKSSAAEQRRSYADGAREQAAFRKARQAIEQKRAADLATLERDRRRKENHFGALRTNLEQERDLERRRVQAEFQARVARIDQQIDNLLQSESSELASHLSHLQHAYVTSVLLNTSLARAELPGIKDGLKANLKANGFSFAADLKRLAYVKVEGIGKKKKAALMAWLSRIENQACACMPKTLTPAQSHGIQARHWSMRTALEAERQAVWCRHSDEMDAVHSQFRQKQDDLLARQAAWIGDVVRSEENTVHARCDLELAKCAAAAAASASAVQMRNDEIDRRMQETRSVSSSLEWRRGWIRREVAQFDAVRFSKYLRRIAPRLIAVATAALIAASALYYFFTLAKPPTAAMTSEVTRLAPQAWIHSTDTKARRQGAWPTGLSVAAMILSEEEWRVREG